MKKNKKLEDLRKKVPDAIKKGIDKHFECTCSPTDLQPFGECVCGFIKSLPESSAEYVKQYLDKMGIELVPQDVVREPLIAPKYIKFRHRYINKITGKVILGEWIDYSEYPTQPKSFGLFNFLWRKRMDFEKEQEDCETFSWNILNR